MEPPSATQAFGVNPFPIRFMNRTVPCEVLRADRGLRANENREMIAGSRRNQAIQAHYKIKWFYL